MKIVKILIKCMFVVVLLFNFLTINAQQPDTFYTLHGGNAIWAKIIESQNVELSTDSKSVQLVSNATSGYFITEQQFTTSTFSRGLPSWNGYAPFNQASAFKVQLRVRTEGSWSPWLTAGFWKNYIWSDYGAIDFSYGEIDIDYLVLNTYADAFQYKVIFLRNSTSYESPRVEKLSFSMSDQLRTDNWSLAAALADKPTEIFIPTNFVYQYAVDATIGGSICSPSSVSMILQSLGKQINTYQFAVDTKDPYHNMFGVWPRNVQHAAHYGVEGYVGRLRSWSDAAAILQAGGRLAMSLGKPLYSGHLIMLAGFDATGNPIVHDPAKSSGYSYKHSKSDLSTSWFAKGGIAYIFFKKPETTSISHVSKEELTLSVFPNPINETSQIQFTLPSKAHVSANLLDLNGKIISPIFNQNLEQGTHSISIISENMNFQNMQNGVYFLSLEYNGQKIVQRILKF